MRLTETLKRKIKDAMVERYLPEANVGKLEEGIEARAEALVRATIPPEILALAEKWPGYVNTENDVRFSNGHGSPREYFEAGSIGWRLPHPLPCASNYHFLPRDEEIARLDTEREKARDARKALREKIRSVLDSCTTTKQVIEALPEAEPFIPADARAGLPVPVQVYESLRAELHALAEKDRVEP